MKKYFATLAVSLLLAGTASAAGWQSLGRIDALTQLPDVDNCEQRVINHYSDPKTVYYPSAIDTSDSGQTQFIFDLQLSSLVSFSRSSAANSNFKTAYDNYSARTGAKSISGSVWITRSPLRVSSVSIDVFYNITPGGMTGSYSHVVKSERMFYELQQLCPL
jgi:hypothetical protein